MDSTETSLFKNSTKEIACTQSKGQKRFSPIITFHYDVTSLGDKRRHKALIDTRELNRTFEQMFAAP